MCIDICPVGALTSGTYRYKTRPWEMRYVSTVCTHCSNGCKTTLSVRNNEILRANNRDLSGMNRDFLCVKGRFGFDFVHHPDRLMQPMLRRDGSLQPASWEDALSHAAAELARIRNSFGADSIGFIGSNRTTNEENYLFQRLARAVIGTNNVDHHRTADYAGLFAALGPAAEDSLATMEQLGAAKAFLLIGNDATEQNPLAAWQIRTAIRNSGAKLFTIHGEAMKLARKSAKHVLVPAGSLPGVAHWLADGTGDLDSEVALDLTELRGALAREQDVVILFGAALQGAALRALVRFGATLPGKTRYVALGDAANSRGAADMGVLPDRLPGFARLDDPAARERFGKKWGVELPAKPGRNAREMMQAAAEGKLKALVVMGANPAKTYGAELAAGLARLELLVVFDLFATETAAQAHVLLPATCAYEKDGTVTNTSGEVQLLRKALDTMGPRSDFDLLRILSHQLARAGAGKAIHLRTPEAAFEEIREMVNGYRVEQAALLTGGAVPARPLLPADGHPPYDVPADLIFSSRDSLFTSGTLGRYCSMINSLPEARETPEPEVVKSAP
jgi:NADH-quinone oxidoreductase subunit G